MYMIAILPPADVEEQIREFQRKMAVDYGSAEALKRPVHITLIPPFRRTEGEMKEIGNVVGNFFEGEDPFLVHLNGFGTFQRNKVIFVNVDQPTPLKLFREELRSVLELEGGVHLEEKEKKFHPHITIGYRDLHEDLYEEARDDFRDREFVASWKVGSIDILEHDGVWKLKRSFFIE